MSRVGKDSRQPEADTPPAYLLPLFNPAWLPGPLRPFTEAVALNLGVPLEMTALQSLGLVSALAGHVVDVEARRGWNEPATLYTLTVSASGTGKSPALKPFTRLLREVEKTRKELALGQFNECLRELEAGGDEKKKELAEAKKQGPPKPRLYFTDATDEKLGPLMQQNGGAAVVWAAEPKLFRTAGGAYAKSGSAPTDVLLSAYTGEDIRIERVTSPPIYVEDPRLTIVLMAQRKPVEDFLENTGHDQRGELARFLMSLPPDCRGFRIFGPDVPLDALRRASECARRLGELGLKERRVVTLDSEARTRFERWRTEHEVRQRPGGAWREPEAWVSKMPGLVVRLAALLHIAETVSNVGEITTDEGVTSEIPLERLERAIAITEWGLEQARDVYRVTQQNPVARQLDHLRETLRACPGILRSRLWESIKGSQGFKRVGDLDPLLNELEAGGELKRERLEPGKKGGRPGERYWLLDGGSREGIPGMARPDSPLDNHTRTPRKPLSGASGVSAGEEAASGRGGAR
jgi:hypothetical protein